jgi:ribose transport system substrate-binding protein
MKNLLMTSLIVGAMMLAGCGSGGGENSTPDVKKVEPATTASTATTAGGSSTDKKSLNIVMIAKSNSNPVFPASRKGAEAAAKEFKEKEGLDIKIDWQTPDDEDGQVQAQRIEQAVTNGADAILVSCSDAAKVTGAINAAADKGVAVMTFDSDAPDSKRFAFYGTDDTDAGMQVMDELGKLINGKGNIAICGGNQNAPNLQLRIKAIKDAAAKMPGIKIVDTYYHAETPQDASNAVESAMKAHPEITAWAMPGGWPLFAKSLLSMDPNKVKIVAVDCLPAQMSYVDKGIAPVLLAQPVFNWGYESVKIMVDKLIHKKDVPVINKMKLERIDKARLGEWGKQLKSWGFDDVDPLYLK